LHNTHTTTHNNHPHTHTTITQHTPTHTTNTHTYTQPHTTKIRPLHVKCTRCLKLEINKFNYYIETIHHAITSKLLLQSHTYSFFFYFHLNDLTISSALIFSSCVPQKTGNLYFCNMSGFY